MDMLLVPQNLPPEANCFNLPNGSARPAHNKASCADGATGNSQAIWF